MSTNLQFITDANGEKTAVIVPIDKYEQMQELLEDSHLSRVASESKDESRRPFAEVVNEMRAEGEIDV